MVKDNSKWKINLSLLKNTYPEVIYLTGQYQREFQLSDQSSIWLSFLKNKKQKQKKKYILVIWLNEKHNGDDSSGKNLLNLYSLDYMHINLRSGRNNFETYEYYFQRTPKPSVFISPASKSSSSKPTVSTWSFFHTPALLSTSRAYLVSFFYTTQLRNPRQKRKDRKRQNPKLQTGPSSSLKTYLRGLSGMMSLQQSKHSYLEWNFPGL